MISDVNPYAAPQTAEIRDKPTDDESVRREYLSHEASVQSIGSLYLIATVLLLVALIPTTVDIARGAEGGWLIGLILIGFIGLSGAMAYGLLRLRRWARVTGIILAIPGLLVLPLGTLISGYILYLLASRKSGVVFSDEYRRVINATPHIKYRTPWLVWLFLILILALFLIGIVAAILG